MSWFKRTSSVREDGRVAVNGQSSPGQTGGGNSRDRADTDPDTCFEVFKNHWQQALNVIEAGSKKTCSSDDVETVVHNFEQMMTLLVGEEGIDGMPGPILHFLLEKEVLERFCNWCSSQRDHQDKLCMEQLRVYELLISQSRQLLLIHRQVIRPLLRLLMACAEPRPPGSSSEELQFRLVLVLHQICTCISQETVILESFFSTEADHGPAKFLIFSLLIPYIHKEGPIGQRARDALLLLMTLSAVHPHIGHYIADNSDFCPVLATGLSGLYSSLPRKITPPSDDWYALTESDCQRIVDLQMFLNSLEFCNAVVQVAHPLVRDQLIKYIYTGFLVPVLGPALHQNSRDEVMTATAYLDLFLRRISEPHLIRAFLRFVLTERHDEMLILESLITRINSNSKLCLVSLSLFHTLVDMNCEEVMFQLVFKYLIPCTHVMVSQRRAVRDLDLYGKSAEKFLSLRPVCCMTYPTPTSNPTPQGSSPAPTGTPSPVLTGRTQPPSRTDAGRSASVSLPAELAKVPTRPEPRRRSFFRSKKENKTLPTLPELEQKPPSDTASIASTESAIIVAEDTSTFSESSYTEYLLQARSVLEQCARACRNWSAPYDGEHPPPDAVLEHPDPPSSASNSNTTEKVEGKSSRESSEEINKSSASDTAGERQRSNSTVKLLSHGNVPDPGSVHPPDSLTLEGQTNSAQKPSGASMVGGGDNPPMSLSPSDVSSSVIADQQCNKVPPSLSTPPASDPFQHAVLNIDHDKLHMCLHDLDSFLAFLNEMNLSAESTNKSLEESLTSLDHLLKTLTGQRGHDSSVKKSADALLSSPSQDGMGAEKQTGAAPPSNISTSRSSSTSASATTNPASSSSVQIRTALPPKSLGLNPAKDVSLGGKCRALSPLTRTPDDMSRAFLMSPTSPGFLLSPSCSSSSGLRPLPTALRYSNAAPNIGPFLAAVFGRLEGMVQNSLYSNLLLTGLVSRLAAYPHPLLRSFLLNVNLVFQPSVKSLVQVLSSVRQKVDNYAVTTRNFSALIPKARLNLKMREDSLLFPSQAPPTADFFGGQVNKPRAATVSEMPSEKKKLSLADLFRRSPKQKPGGQRGRGQQLQRVQVGGGVGYRFINSRREDTPDSPEESLKTWNAVYCALLLEEFLKELAALSLEHSVLHYDEGYVSS